MQVFNYTDSDFIKDSGMAIDTQPITIQGRVLEAPTIEYGRGQTLVGVYLFLQVLSDPPLCDLKQRIPPKAGAWNVVGQMFHQPGLLHTWAVIYFKGHGHEEQVKRFVTGLVNNLLNLGMFFSKPISA